MKRILIVFAIVLFVTVNIYSEDTDERIKEDIEEITERLENLEEENEQLVMELDELKREEAVEESIPMDQKDQWGKGLGLELGGGGLDMYFGILSPKINNRVALGLNFGMHYGIMWDEDAEEDEEIIGASFFSLTPNIIITSPLRFNFLRSYLRLSIPVGFLPYNGFHFNLFADISAGIEIYTKKWHAMFIEAGVIPISMYYSKSDSGNTNFLVVPVPTFNFRIGMRFFPGRNKE